MNIAINFRKNGSLELSIKPESKFIDLYLPMILNGKNRSEYYNCEVTAKKFFSLIKNLSRKKGKPSQQCIKIH